MKMCACKGGGSATSPTSVLLLLSILAAAKYGEGSQTFPKFGFLEEPSDLVVRRNDPAMLHCSCMGPGTPTIRWKRDGEYLQFPDFNDRRRLLSNGSLFFSSVYHTRVKRPDEGLYQCVATADGVGTIISKTATLRVAGLSPRFSAEPSDQSAKLGQVTFFPCAIGGHRTASSSVVWLRDDQPLQLDHRMTVLPSDALVINGVKLSDRGGYKCRVQEGGDTRTSAQGQLRIDLASSNSNEVSFPPSFIATPRNAKVSLGSTLTLDCAANGNPAPFITWLKDGATVDVSHLDSRFSKVGAGSLKIVDLAVEDRGTYQCRAENSGDSVDAAAVVEVEVLPRFVRAPQNAEADAKGDIELECQVFAVPEATVQWYKNGDLIIESEYFQIVHGTNLKILGLVELDSGVYQCVASNSAGNVQASAQLVVRPKESKAKNSQPSPSNTLPSVINPHRRKLGHKTTQATREDNQQLPLHVLRPTPGPPGNLRAVVISRRFLTLSWSRPEEHIQGYSVFYKQVGSERERVLNSTLEEVNVQGLTPGSAYSLRVVAHNEHGVGHSSEPLVVSTQDEVDVPGPVSNLKARPTSSFSILVTWGRPTRGRNERVNSYKIYYRQSDDMDVQSAMVKAPQFHLSDLREYTEYTFWVSAFNDNGEGALSEEVMTRTMSATPADPPQNISLEAAGATSLIARWEPPPKESQNGLITGYKIRWRPSSESTSRGEVVTTDGSRRLYAITGLKNGQEYQVKISAMTVNGSGPATPWLSTRTFLSDLDESVVPSPPSSLSASARADQISVRWTPPRDGRVLVRGYTVGWGRGIPDEYTSVVDAKQRGHVIVGLRPNSEYVISLRAYNNIGDGRPIYETIRTRDENDEAEEAARFSAPLLPPGGLFARILSAKTALLTWMDSSLPRNQLIPDDRYYIVRYTESKSLQTHKPKHQYRNSTDLNVMLDDLKPDTEYEFVVKVLKGRRQSRWSMVALNRTQEASPGSPPRDLVVRANGASGVSLRWRPPKATNGRINGYLIQYTDDKRADDRKWFVEAVAGEGTSAVIRNLRPDTKYYFKVGARNSKGYGPSGAVVAFVTGSGSEASYETNQPPPSVASGGVRSSSDPSPNEVSPVILYAVAGVGAGIIIVIIIGAAILIHRCGQNSAAAAAAVAAAAKANNDRLNKSYLSTESGAGGQKDRLNPPPGPPSDLWLAHDQMELKALDGDETGETSLARSSPIDYRSASSMDRSRNFGLPYSGTESEISFSVGGSSHRGSFVHKSKRGSCLHKALASTSSPTQQLLQQAQQPVKIAAINGKPRVQRYLSRESVASSSIPSSSCNGSSSTYIRSAYNLNPPPAASTAAGSSACALSPSDELPPPGYEPSLTAPPSELSAPSTIEEPPSVGWNSVQQQQQQLQQQQHCCPVAVAPPQLPPTYLSSALSTSSADSSSGNSGNTRSSGSNTRQTSSSSGSGVAHHHPMKSFNQQPKSVIVRPQPSSSPLKSSLLRPSGGPSSSFQSGECCDGTPLHSGQLPAVAEVRSPDVLHSISHPVMPSLSTEELNAEMKNLEGLMKDLSSISQKPQQNQQQHFHHQC